MPIMRVSGKLADLGNVFSLSAIGGYMLFPGVRESFERARARDTMWKMYLMSDPAILKRATKAQLRAANETMANSWTFAELKKRFTNREFDGRLVGMAINLMVGPDGPKLRTLGAAREQVLHEIRGKGGRNIDVRQFDAIWRQMRSAAHLWAARCYILDTGGKQPFPCLPKISWFFVYVAHHFLEEGSSFHLRGGKRSTLLSCEEAWNFPAGLVADAAQRTRRVLNPRNRVPI